MVAEQSSNHCSISFSRLVVSSSVFFFDARARWLSCSFSTIFLRSYLVGVGWMEGVSSGGGREGWRERGLEALDYSYDLPTGRNSFSFGQMSMR